MEVEVSDSVAVVRQKARLSDHNFRSKKRYAQWNRRRSNLSDVEKDIKIPSVEELAHLCAQLRKKKNPETLWKIRQSLSLGGERITTFLNTEGALYALVGCLSGTDAALQREALCTLVNLGQGTEKECEKIYDSVGVYLALIFSNTSDPSQHDLCAWCIGNLCGGHSRVCAKFQQHDTLHWLLELLKSRVPHVFQSSAYALTHYFTTVPEEMTKVDYESLTSSVIDGLRTVGEATEEASWLLFVLSADHNYCQLMISMDIISIALNTLEDIINQQNFNISSATALVRVLLNCVGASPKSAELVFHRSEKFVTISKSLLYSPYPHLRKETLQMIANVVNSASGLTDGFDAALVDDMRLKLERAVRSALASNFSNDVLTSQTNFSNTSASITDFGDTSASPTDCGGASASTTDCDGASALHTDFGEKMCLS